MKEYQTTRDIEYLRKKASALPQLPGVYIMHGRDGNVIYVGKSRSLRDRVSQYFHGTHDIKTDNMAGSVYDFEFVTCSTEMEALSLENRLIKHHSPKYNIKLKDAKSYPYIKLNVNADYPTLSMTRTRINDGSLYFGPYSSTSTVYSVISSLQKTLGIPSCKHKFPSDIGKVRPCVNFQIGRCMGVCTGNVSPEDYRASVETAASILNGGTSAPIKELTERMYRHSEALEFELAAKCRNTIEALKKLGTKQVAVTSPNVECDVFGLCTADDSNTSHGSISVFYIRSGYIADRDHFLFDGDVIINSDDDSPFTSFIGAHYAQREYIPREILLSFDISENDSELIESYLSDKAGRKVSVKTPKRGASASLCRLAVNDAESQAENKISANKATEKMLCRLAEVLHLEVIPERIEAYDVSNLGREHITVGKITAINGKFSKKDYRSYNITGLDSPDDYYSMREAVMRRFSHMEDEDFSPATLPDLILLDGGIGHVNVVGELLEKLGVSVPVFGMVKDEHHKTRTLVSSDGEIDISKKTDVFGFVFSLQEEVHRFTVGKMSNAKRKTLRTSSLSDISGIGPAKAKLLLKYFGTLSRIKSAEKNELTAVPGISDGIADNIIKYYSDKKG